ncbi:MAG: hypothetical protein QM695_09015 [Micropruina sp.]
MLRRGVRAGSSLEAAGGELHPADARTRQLRGAIAIAAGGLDAESRGVVTSVIAMAAPLEKTVGLNQARQSLRSGLVRSRPTDDPSVAAPVVRELWTPLPPETVVVAVATVPAARAQVASDWLDQSADHSVFHGPGPDGLVIAVADAEQVLLDQFAALFEAGSAYRDRAVTATSPGPTPRRWPRSPGPAAPPRSPGSPRSPGTEVLVLLTGTQAVVVAEAHRVRRGRTTGGRHRSAAHGAGLAGMRRPDRRGGAAARCPSSHGAGPDRPGAEAARRRSRRFPGASRTVAALLASE